MDPFRSASDPSVARPISIKGLRVIWSLGGALPGRDKDMWNGQSLLFNLTRLSPCPAPVRKTTPIVGPRLLGPHRKRFPREGPSILGKIAAVGHRRDLSTITQRRAHEEAGSPTA